MPSRVDPNIGPRRLARYVLSRQQNVIKMRAGNLKNEPPSCLYFLIANPQGRDGIAFVEREHLPSDITKWFSVAGREFERNFNALCHTVIFCSFLEIEVAPGKFQWERGFNIIPGEAEENEVMAVLGEDLFSQRLYVMFVNMFDRTGVRVLDVGAAAFPLMLYPLGHLKINDIFMKRGIRMSHAASSFYACAYERRAVIGLRDYWLGQGSEKETKEAVGIVEVINRMLLPDINARMRKAFLDMPRAERSRFKLSPNVSPQNIGNDGCYVVELL